MTRTLNGITYDHNWWQNITQAATDDGLDPDTALWGWKRVDGALVSSRGFRWPTRGWVEDTSGIIYSNTTGCPKREGDGLTVATAWQGGLQHGPRHGATVLLVAANPDDVLGRGTGKFRTGRVWVAEPLDLYGLLREAPGANLSRADLPRANLGGANLYGADLSRANLSGANLGGANLYGADLSRANLSGADFYGANLYRTNLSGANLSGADFYGANLGGANLYGADLSGAHLYGAYLSRADLGGWERGPDGYARRTVAKVPTGATHTQMEQT